MDKPVTSPAELAPSMQDKGRAIGGPESSEGRGFVLGMMTAHRMLREHMPRSFGLTSTCAEIEKVVVAYINQGSVPEIPSLPFVPPAIAVTAPMLRNALYWANPDGSPEHDEAVWLIGPLEDHEDGPGLYMWLEDYPEEGALPLEGEAPQPALSASPEQKSDGAQT